MADSSTTFLQCHSSRTTLDPLTNVCSKSDAFGASPALCACSPFVKATYSQMCLEGKHIVHLHISGAVGPTQTRNIRLIRHKLHRSAE